MAEPCLRHEVRGSYIRRRELPPLTPQPSPREERGEEKCAPRFAT